MTAVAVTSQAATGHRPAAVVKVSLVSIDEGRKCKPRVERAVRLSEQYSSHSPEGGAWERGTEVLILIDLYIGQMAGIQLKSNLNCM